MCVYVGVSEESEEERKSLGGMETHQELGYQIDSVAIHVKED